MVVPPHAQASRWRSHLDGALGYLPENSSDGSRSRARTRTSSNPHASFVKDSLDSVLIQYPNEGDIALARETLMPFSLFRGKVPIIWKAIHKNCTLRIADVQNGRVKIGSNQMNICADIFNLGQPHIHLKQKLIT